TQSNTTTSNYRAILYGYNNSTDVSTLTTTVTNQVMASSSIYAQPSTGTLYASKYNGYKVGGDPGNWFSSISVIRNDGVMEAGKYIDFHTTNTGTTDYDVRLTAESGKLTCSGSISAKSFSGNATSASKLATARTITLGSGLQGSVSFDGSANVTLNGSLKRCSFYDDASDWSKYPWRKIANIAVGGSNSDRSITFMVTNPWASPLIGILSSTYTCRWYSGCLWSRSFKMVIFDRYSWHIYKTRKILLWCIQIIQDQHLVLKFGLKIPVGIMDICSLFWTNHIEQVSIMHGH
ncbi:hypothetical protein OBE_00625, partial [human gut metagenome]